jgi:hypothetical protein
VGEALPEAHRGVAPRSPPPFVSSFILWGVPCRPTGWDGSGYRVHDGLLAAVAITRIHTLRGDDTLLSALRARPNIRPKKVNIRQLVVSWHYRERLGRPCMWLPGGMAERLSCVICAPRISNGPSCENSSLTWRRHREQVGISWSKHLVQNGKVHMAVDQLWDTLRPTFGPKGKSGCVRRMSLES